MTYLVQRTKSRRMARRARPGLGGILDDAVSIFTGLPTPDQTLAATGVSVPSIYDVIVSQATGIDPVDVMTLLDQAESPVPCQDAANAQQTTFMANVTNLATNWNPSGFYSPDQLHSIVTQVMGLVTQAQADVTTALSSWSGNPDVLTNAMDNLNRQATGQGVLGIAGTNAQQYLATEAQARAANVAVIDAADLKSWAVFTLTAVSNAYVAIYVVNCEIPTWIAVLAKVAAALAAVVSFVIGVLGVIAQIGEAVLEAPTAASGLITVVKWGALAWLAYWGYNKYRASR